MKTSTGIDYLYCRNGRYTVRVQVPKDVQSRLGWTEFKRSLGANFAAAKRQCHSVIANFIGQIEAARRANVTQPIALQSVGIPQIESAVQAHYERMAERIAESGGSDRHEKIAALNVVRCFLRCRLALQEVLDAQLTSPVAFRVRRRRRRGCVSERGERPFCAIIVNPSGADRSGLPDREEQRVIEQLVAHAIIKGLDEPVLRWSAGCNILPLEPDSAAPGQHRVRRQLRAVVANDLLRRTAPGDQLTQPRPQVAIIRSARAIRHAGAIRSDGSTHLPLAHPQRSQEVRDSFPLCGGRHHFLKAGPSDPRCQAAASGASPPPPAPEAACVGHLQSAELSLPRIIGRARHAMLTA